MLPPKRHKSCLLLQLKLIYVLRLLASFENLIILANRLWVCWIYILSTELYWSQSRTETCCFIPTRLSSQARTWGQNCEKKNRWSRDNNTERLNATQWVHPFLSESHFFTSPLAHLIRVNLEAYSKGSGFLRVAFGERGPTHLDDSHLVINDRWLQTWGHIGSDEVDWGHFPWRIMVSHIQKAEHCHWRLCWWEALKFCVFMWVVNWWIANYSLFLSWHTLVRS